MLCITFSNIDLITSVDDVLFTIYSPCPRHLAFESCANVEQKLASMQKGIEKRNAGYNTHGFRLPATKGDDVQLHGTLPIA
jgi:hypothetical protein